MSAVLAALAGVRVNQRVMVIGHGPIVRRALEAGTGCPLVEQAPADVVVALMAPDVPGAVTCLAPGGRIVAIAADNGAVERTTQRHGLVLRHTEMVGGRVVWSASPPT
ncbi:MAG: hypothetical protein JWO12_1456 [Frankiales bacterium]|nr:hypothetical protein [Frankiales bacterium]